MESKYYEIDYKFSSAIGELGGGRFITTIKGEVYEFDHNYDKKEEIGKFTLKLILIGLALNNNFSVCDVFDTEEYTFRIGEHIYDFEEEELDISIIDFYDTAFFNPNICIITELEIVAAYRRKGIGKKVVKDICNRFEGSCGLFVVQAYPIQFERRSEDTTSPNWSEKMKLDTLEKDFEKSFYQLKAFYQKIGFDHIDGFDELMFLNPSLSNSKLESIGLD